MRLIIVGLLLANIGSASAAAFAPDDGFVAVAGGFHFPNGEVRTLVDNNYGMHLNLGLGAYGQAMIGFPTFEFDWGHITGKGSRLDTLNVTYCERIRLQDGVYVGGGAGTVCNRLVRSVTAGGSGDNMTSYGLCLRGVLGVTISRQFFVEAVAFYNGKIDGLDANAVAVQAGVRF